MSLQGIVAARASAVLVDALLPMPTYMFSELVMAEMAQLRPAVLKNPVQSRLETHPSTVIYIAILLRVIIMMVG